MKLPFGWALTRSEPRRVRGGRRMFAGSRQDNTTADWPSDTQPIDEILRAHLPVLRARSRHEVRNGPHGKHFVRLCKVNIIGDCGISLQARARDGAGKQDKPVNRAIEDAFEDWGESRYCDYERVLTWLQMQDLIIETWAKDGEAILRRHLFEPDNPYALSYQLLDPELLDVAYWEDIPDGRYIRMGVEFDARHRPLAYHFRNRPGAISLGQRRIRIPAEEIMHIFERSEVGQSRGIPWMATALYQLRQGSAYADAAVVAARAGAVRGGFFETAPGAGKYKADDEDDKGNQVMDLGPDHQFEQLPEGLKFSPYSGDYPRGEFAEFDKAIGRRTSAGVGTSYAALTGDLSETSFASMRQGVNYERDVWKLLQRNMVSNIIRPSHRLWVRQQMLTGTIRVNGVPLDPNREGEYVRAAWQPRTWGYVNPLQDAQADTEKIRNRTQTVSGVIRERGGDPDEVFEEWARDKERFEELGVPMDAAPANPLLPEPPPKDESTDVPDPKTEGK